MEIEQLLRQGETVLTFTPQQAGTIPFSRSTGMFAGTLTVLASGS